MTGYTDELDADRQISMEEAIASVIFDTIENETTDISLEALAGDLGRRILAMVLVEFRPDLFDGQEK